MSEIVTLELPVVLAQNARSVAAQTQRRIEDVLVEWLDRAATDIPVDALRDDQVLALVELQMSKPQQAELSELLAGQREGILDELERLRLAGLMDITVVEWCVRHRRYRLQSGVACDHNSPDGACSSRY